ncbi:hypothetical protein PMAYCL1PPCAC_16727, partial [Pristionchus mayeri]
PSQMSTTSSGHNFVLATASVGLVVTLFISMASLLSVIQDVNIMHAETLIEIGEFKYLADTTWNSLTMDSTFMAGVRATRGSGFAGAGAPRVGRGGEYAGASSAGGYSAPSAAAAGGGCNCAAKASGCPIGPPGPPGENGEAGAPGMPGAPGSSGMSGMAAAYPMMMECIKC